MSCVSGRCCLGFLILLLVSAPIRLAAEEDADEARLKSAESAAVALVQRLVRGETAALGGELDPAPVLAEARVRLAARGVEFRNPDEERVLQSLFESAFAGVCKGIAADVKDMNFEITGRWVRGDRVTVVAHGERAGQVHFFLLEMAPTAAGWRLASLVQPFSTVDVPELAIGMLVGFAERQNESESQDAGADTTRILLVSSGVLALLLFAAGRAPQPRRRAAVAGAVLLWLLLGAVAWVGIALRIPPDLRVRRALLALPEAPLFLSLRVAKFEPALAALTEALHDRPRDPRLLAWRAFLIQAMPRKEIPPGLWSALLDYPPTRVAAHDALTHQALAAGDLEGARPHLTAVVEALGDDPYLKAKLLWLRARLGERETLDVQFLAALAQACSPTPVLLLRAKAFAAQGRRNAAFADLQQLAGMGTLFREMVTRDQDLAVLADDPRVQDLVARLPSMARD